MVARIVALFATLLAGAAHGAVVHRCRLADGSVAYRDTGCAAGETLLSRMAYDAGAAARDGRMPAPAASRAGAPRDGAAGDRPAARAARFARAPASSQRSTRADEIVAHECRFGEQRWVQAQACPAKMQGEKQSVHETRLTRAGVCAALRGLSAAQSPGEGSARRAYGMNRLRQRHGC